MLEVRNVKKTFGKQKILNGVGLTLDKGDVKVIIGPSGSGKTTFLRCLNFLERADEGEMRIDDLSVNFRSVSSKSVYKVRQKTAMVFQNYCLFSNKTVLQNVTEGLVVARHVPKKEACDKAMAMLEKVGLQDKLHEYPCYLSGGQQQRVGIARAMALDPELILFDEPTSALDPELVGECLKCIQNVAKEGIPMLIVTHEMLFAYEIAGSVIFLEEGLVVEEGAPKQMFSSPKEERTKQFLSRFNLTSQYTI
ncbi:amino acid ABC transporter ATP-binding protein [Treponema endosymbiont of Eucomonympha sp.]|uniref:amino acid ABC transporter ATP-binding protein n=1 Tax=Treponema endosymbiont of Eucomonympha sp. TaxID=1580831 RepID=UPI000785E259|nr:amino acid ABC transporter ATP-binding protein [Treponema endosymbiont of Eucomonympha sp.]